MPDQEAVVCNGFLRSFDMGEPLQNTEKREPRCGKAEVGGRKPFQDRCAAFRWFIHPISSTELALHSAVHSLLRLWLDRRPSLRPH